MALTEEDAMKATMGKGIAFMRKKCELTQGGLAKEMGWVQQRISAMEKGQRLDAVSWTMLRAYFIRRLGLEFEVAEELMMSGGERPRTHLSLVVIDEDADSVVSRMVYAHSPADLRFRERSEVANGANARVVNGAVIPRVIPPVALAG